MKKTRVLEKVLLNCNLSQLDLKNAAVEQVTDVVELDSGESVVLEPSAEDLEKWFEAEERNMSC